MKEKRKNYWDECILCGCWYCRFFARYVSHSHSLKESFIRMWFWFPRFLWRKTYKGTEDRNMKFELWHGCYIWPLPGEGGVLEYWWFKRIKFNWRFILKDF